MRILGAWPISTCRPAGVILEAVRPMGSPTRPARRAGNSVAYIADWPRTWDLRGDHPKGSQGIVAGFSCGRAGDFRAVRASARGCVMMIAEGKWLERYVDERMREYEDRIRQRKLEKAGKGARRLQQAVERART